MTFDVWGADDKREITVNFVLHSSLEWELSQLFLSVSMKKHGEPLRMDWTGIIGKKGKCQVIIRKYAKNDGTEGVTNDIKYFYAYDEQVTTVSPAVAQPAPQQYVQPTYPHSITHSLQRQILRCPITGHRVAFNAAYDRIRMKRRMPFSGVGKAI